MWQKAALCELAVTPLAMDTNDREAPSATASYPGLPRRPPMIDEGSSARHRAMLEPAIPQRRHGACASLIASHVPERLTALYTILVKELERARGAVFAYLGL